MNMSQFALQWPAHAAYHAEDLLVGKANHAAVSFIGSWPESGGSAALLVGPESSGKTHLATIWQQRCNAQAINGAQLGSVPSDEIWGNSPVALMENIERIRNEEAFFHLLRHAENTRKHLLMTSRLAASDLSFITPDLTSRLKSVQAIFIGTPDDALLEAFFSKAFSDRQWRVPATVLRYIVPRTERSFSGAQELLRRLESVIASTNRELTIPLIKPLIE